jgi:hypothetical protein
MTIQRQYTLPNCNLILEGLSSNANDPLAPMSVLMNAECNLPGATDATLAGGREFLDHLVAAVNRYAQQRLSGISRPVDAPGDTPPLVDIKPGDGPYHHLIVRQQAPGEPQQDTEATAPLDVKLSTVQFYDLMEAVDQLLADNQTLPDLQPQFQAVSRRLVKPPEPATKRAAPAAIGAAALAAASIGLFFVPPPEFEPSRSSQESETPADALETVPTGEPPASEETAPSEDQSSRPGAESQTNPAELDPEAAAAELDRLADAPNITNRALLATLQGNLSRRLAADWTATPAPTEDWTYRVAVAENGDILGYKYQDTPALENVASTPLARLAFEPVDETEPVQEPVAQFEVSFTPAGQVEVAPWGDTAAALEADAGTNGAEVVEADATATETDAPSAVTANNVGSSGELPALDSPITDADTIRSLNSSLYDRILADLDPLSANEPLEYRVRVSEDGDIVGYEPLNAPGVLLDDETPLSSLVTSAGGTDSQADYRVVFTEDGVLEVSPWDGWPD